MNNTKNKTNKVIDTLYWLFIVISIYPLYGMLFSVLANIMAVASTGFYSLLNLPKLIALVLALSIIGTVVRKQKILAVILSSSILLLYFILMIILMLLYRYNTDMHNLNLLMDFISKIDPHGLLVGHVYFFGCFVVVMALVIIVFFLKQKNKDIVIDNNIVENKQDDIFKKILKWFLWSLILLLMSVICLGMAEDIFMFYYSKKSTYSVVYYCNLFIFIFWCTLLTMFLVRHHRIIAGLFLTVFCIFGAIQAPNELPIFQCVIYVLAIWIAVFYVIRYKKYCSLV